MSDLGRLEAIEIRVSCAEFRREYMKVGDVCPGSLVPPILRALATWHVAALLSPTDFTDSVILRLVGR